MFSKARLIDTRPWLLLLLRLFPADQLEVFEAARMDDAGEWKIMLKVALPMCRSSLIATMMFSVIGIWNSYFWPLVMTNSDKFRPIPIIYCFGSKQIIKAFTYNGIK